MGPIKIGDWVRVGSRHWLHGNEIGRVIDVKGARFQIEFEQKQGWGKFLWLEERDFTVEK